MIITILKIQLVRVVTPSQIAANSGTTNVVGVPNSSKVVIGSSTTTVNKVLNLFIVFQRISKNLIFMSIFLDGNKFISPITSQQRHINYKQTSSKT